MSPEPAGRNLVCPPRSCFSVALRHQGRIAAAGSARSCSSGWRRYEWAPLLRGAGGGGEHRRLGTGDATLVAVLVGIAIGSVFLVPSLMLLFGLPLSGRFDPAAIDARSGERTVTARADRKRAGSIAVLALIVAGVPLTLFGGGVLLASAWCP